MRVWQRNLCLVVVELGLLHSVSVASEQFDLEVAARPGDVSEFGEVVLSLGVESSVVAGGAVGFRGTVEDGGDSGEAALVRQRTGAFSVISDGLDGRRVNFVQLSESGAGMARERDGLDFLIQLYNWVEPVEVLTAVSTGTGAFDFVTVPTIAADSGFSFVGTLAGSFDAQIFVNGVAEGGLDGGGHRPFAANGGRAVVRSGDAGSGEISVYGQGVSVVADTDSTDWVRVGRMPGFSQGAEAVAFYGEGSASGTGVYVALRNPSGVGYGVPVRVAGPEFDAAGFDFDGDGRRVGVEVDGDVLRVVFVGEELGGNVGVWVVTAEIGAGGVIGAPRLGEVISIGDVVDGQAVTSVFLWDPLAACGVMAFHVGTSDGGRIVRAIPVPPDTDLDGVPDALEVALGTSPTDGASVPEFDFDQFDVGGDTALQLRYSRVVGSGATVETSTDLEQWSVIGVTEIVTGAGGAGELVRATVIGSGRAFLRVRVGCAP